MIVKKTTDTFLNVTGDVETTKKSIKEVDKAEGVMIMDFVQDIIDDDGDPESYYSKGIGDGFDGEICWIKFSWLITYVDDRQSDIPKEEHGETEYKANAEILPILNKYKGYTFKGED